MRTAIEYIWKGEGSGVVPSRREVGGAEELKRGEGRRGKRKAGV